jgi:hypothetical protein
MDYDIQVNLSSIMTSFWMWKIEKFTKAKNEAAKNIQE